jgi:hypothetical protein
MELTKTEEQLMEYLWQQEKAFLKDLIDAFPDPKPAPTTVATLLKRMTDKGFPQLPGVWQLQGISSPDKKIRLLLEAGERSYQK